MKSSTKVLAEIKTLVGNDSTHVTGHNAQAVPKKVLGHGWILITMVV